MQPIIVTAAIIYNDSEFLIAQRKPGKNEELKWEFPGGKLEEGESPEQCLKREIKEELNLEIEVSDIFDVVYYEYPQITILLLVYKCKLIGGEIKLLDCNDYKWIAEEQISDFEFACADIQTVNKMMQNNK